MVYSAKILNVLNFHCGTNLQFSCIKQQRCFLAYREIKRISGLHFSFLYKSKLEGFEF